MSLRGPTAVGADAGLAEGVQRIWAHQTPRLKIVVSPVRVWVSPSAKSPVNPGLFALQPLAPSRVVLRRKASQSLLRASETMHATMDTALDDHQVVADRGESRRPRCRRPATLYEQHLELTGFR
jgi:transposase InsO family protein